jgi:hypothetical protein
MSDQQLTGASLEEALRSGKLDQPALELVGMVKAAEETGKISFTPTDCESWVDIPTDLIEKAEQVGQRPCRDHIHPVFRLQLKQPKDPEAQVLSALLAQRASGERAGVIQSPQSVEFPQMAWRGPHGGLPGWGAPIGPGSVGYFPLPGGRWACVGGLDCLKLAGNKSCSKWECFTGWGTGELVCICTP